MTTDNSIKFQHEACRPKRYVCLVTPGRDPGGFVITTLLGIGGALLAKNIGVAMGYYQNTDRVGFLTAVIGAVIILVLYHLVFMRIRRV